MRFALLIVLLAWPEARAVAATPTARAAAEVDAPRAAVARSPRPMARPQETPMRDVVDTSAGQAGLDAWIAGFRPRALAAGIDAATFERAMRGVRFDPEAIRRDRNQSEFTKTIWDYLGTAVSDLRIANGRQAMARHAAALDAIEARHGVPKEIVAAIWGLESAYGGFRGSDPVIGSLATLAFEGRRAAFFEEQLVAALRILQAGDVTPERMLGSWAGAMGHTQFMPTSFLDHAVDGDGDGRRDVWGDDPTDALASAAAYLAAHGWTAGQPWGVEVRLPEGFDHLQADRRIRRAPSDWAAMGVLDPAGRPVPDHGPASVLLPAGHRGTAFLIFDNFAVLERYNTADAYVIGVGHLADRLAGAGPLRGGWPTGDRALTGDERRELQRRLTAAGFDTKGVDGRIGPLTIDAVRAYQASEGLVPDGYAPPALLERLR